eukprot:1125992-Pleurochrysis_carterae.AAC.1
MSFHSYSNSDRFASKQTVNLHTLKRPCEQESCALLHRVTHAQRRFLIVHAVRHFIARLVQLSDSSGSSRSVIQPVVLATEFRQRLLRRSMTLRGSRAAKAYSAQPPTEENTPPRSETQAKAPERRTFAARVLGFGRQAQEKV